MIIIADSGSTKTDWKIIFKNGIVEAFSDGLNPIYTSEEKIISEINQKVIPLVDSHPIQSVYFYGAGCMAYEKSKEMKHTLQKIFTNANIEVNSDILGAARATFRGNENISVILGTGANVCLYNGKEILQTRSGIGYILGDEGSGAQLGKELLKDYLNLFLAHDISKLFDSQFNLSKSEIIQRIYKSEYPSRFLASFSKFILENEHHPDIKKIIDKCFHEFFKNHIIQFENYPKLEVNFVGSIAFYFKQHIIEIAKEYDAKMGLFIQKPIDGLVKYHETYNL